MNTPKPLSPPSQLSEDGALSEIIAAHFPPLSPPAARADNLRAQLLARVADSAKRHRDLITLRHDDFQWRELTRGIRTCVLHDNGITRSALVEFEPGSHLPSHRHTAHEECIVLRGSLQTGDMHVGLHDYHIAPAGSRHATIGSREGALAFLRGTSIGNGRDMMHEILAAWLPRHGERPRTIAAAEGWHALAPGARVKPLWQQGESTSMLLQMEAGASVPACIRPLEEECLMLSGEAFMGDILLCAGEYQFAPKGSLPRRLASDVGALVFINSSAAYIPAGMPYAIS